MMRSNIGVDDHQEAVLAVFIQRVEEIGEYINNPDELKIELRHLFRNMLYCPQDDPRFMRACVTLISTLQNIPFRYSFGKPWQKFVRMVLSNLPEEYHTADYLALINLLLAKHAYDVVDKDTATQLGNQAYLFAQVAQNAYLVSESAQVLCQTYIYHHGEHEKALQIAQEAHDFISPLSGANLMQKLKLKMLEADALRRLGNIHHARTVLETVGAMGLSATLPARDQALIMLNRGLIRQADGNYPAAATDLECAAIRYEKVKEFASASGAYGDLGLCLWGWGELVQAEKIYHHALQLAIESGDIQREMKLHGNLGLVYISQGRLEEAESRINIHLKTAQELNSPRETNRAKGNLAQLWMYAGKPQKSLNYLKLALNNHTLPNEGRGNDLILLAVCFKRLDMNTMADVYITEAFDICKTKQHTLLPIITNRAAAECTDNPDKAIEYLQTALALAEKRERGLDIAGCLLKLAQLCRHDEAVGYRARAYALLEKMNATAWLNYGETPLLPLMI